MNLRRLTTWLFCGVAAAQAGCQAVEERAKSLLYFSVSSAGYAGRFRLAEGRWPAVGELEEFMCMRGRAERFGMPMLTCEQVVNSPYRIGMKPAGEDLEIRYFEPGGTEVCRLRLVAPRAGAHSDMFPKIIIRSTVFACAGGAWERERVFAG